MRIRTTLFAVTLATAALLGGAGAAAADGSPSSSSDVAPGLAPDVSDSRSHSNSQSNSQSKEREAVGLMPALTGQREVSDESPGGLLGRLMGA